MTVKQSRLISKVLSPALGLWLRSQVQKVSDLEVKIGGSDRQILSGYIPHVSIKAHHAVYRGLHLTQIQLVAESIRINLSAVLKGQSLRLLEPVPVLSEMVLQELDINASLQSPLLANALTDLVSSTLLPSDCQVDAPISWHQVSIDSGQLTLAATLRDTGIDPKSLVLRTGLQLASNHELQLEHPQLQLGGLWKDLESLKLDLGPEVDLQILTLMPGEIICHGRINVVP